MVDVGTLVLRIGKESVLHEVKLFVKSLVGYPKLGGCLLLACKAMRTC